MNRLVPLAKRARLVVVSNRVASLKDPSRAGGLGVALLDALRRSGGVWFGWSGEITERERRTPKLQHYSGLTVATLDLTPDDYEDYYNGFANSTLWPLFHYRLDLATFDREHYQGYVKVNQRFAHTLLPLLEPEDHLWVHDYHLMACGEELRRMGCNHPMGFFLHIPFPARELLATLPTHDVLVRALFSYNVVGFQTEGDRDRFCDYVVHEAKGKRLGRDRLQAFGREIVVEAFPIGIDAKAFTRYASTEEAKEHAARMRRVLANRLAILGVDRLDYSKGLPERFRAFERLLTVYPENRGRVSYIQIAPRSRADVQDYIDIRHELESLSGSINSEYSEFDWTPLRYIQPQLHPPRPRRPVPSRPDRARHAAPRRDEPGGQGSTSRPSRRETRGCWCSRASPVRRDAPTAPSLSTPTTSGALRTRFRPHSTCRSRNARHGGERSSKACAATTSLPGESRFSSVSTRFDDALARRRSRRDPHPIQARRGRCPDRAGAGHRPGDRSRRFQVFAASDRAPVARGATETRAGHQVEAMTGAEAIARHRCVEVRVALTRKSGCRLISVGTVSRARRNLTPSDEISGMTNRRVQRCRHARAVLTSGHNRHQHRPSQG